MPIVPKIGRPLRKTTKKRKSRKTTKRKGRRSGRK